MGEKGNVASAVGLPSEVGDTSIVCSVVNTTTEAVTSTRCRVRRQPARQGHRRRGRRHRRGSPSAAAQGHRPAGRQGLTE